MEQRKLGSSGTTVSALGLGTMTFGAETGEEEAHRQLDRFVEAGGTFVDTADVYTRGASEEILGNWLEGSGLRDGLVIATKGRFPMGDGPLDRGAGRRHLMRAIDASLSRLRTDHVDLYQVHGWDPETPLDETLETLDTIVATGRARHVGWSNVTGWQMQRIVDRCEMSGWSRPVTLQPQYNLLDRSIELEILPMCLEEGIGILPWSPLGGGWLTGKYSPEQRPTGETRLGEDPERGVEAYDKRNVDRTWNVIEVVAEVAGARGVTQAQVALAWVRQRPGVSSVILGARTVTQLEDNLGSSELILDHDEISRLTAASAPGVPPYPHGFLIKQAGFDVWERLGTG